MIVRPASLLCGVLGTLALSVTVVAAADSPWDGTWKFNPAKSKLTGYTFSYKALPGGKLQFSNGAQFAVTFACDGKPYTVVGTGTIVCKTPSSHEFDYTFATGGKTTTTSVLKLSPDGKTIAQNDKNFHPDGTTTTTSATYTRIAGGPGLVGSWKQTDVKINAPDSFTYKTFAGGVDIAYPRYKQTIHLTFDGKPSVLKGPTVSPGTTTTAVSAGPLSYTETDKIGTRVLNLAKTTVSADGKTMTAVSWDPGKKDEAATYVYDKQ
jgi:hypothetical protein